MNEHGFTCPCCGSPDVRRSRTQGFAEVPKMVFGVYPFRCLACSERFFGNVWLLNTRGYANCPKCLRLSVNPVGKKEARLTQLDMIKLTLGAHTYRCVPCRHTFLSFRKCIVVDAPQVTVNPEHEPAEQHVSKSTD